MSSANSDSYGHAPKIENGGNVAQLERLRTAGSKILFTDVNILDSTGRDPYGGDVLVEGQRITKVGVVPNAADLQKDPKVRVFRGRGRTLMSGLGTHIPISPGMEET